MLAEADRTTAPPAPAEELSEWRETNAFEFAFDEK